MPLSELAGFLPQVGFTPDMVLRVMELGLAELSEEAGQATVRSPSFLSVGSEPAALGVPPEVILDEYEVLSDEATRIAGRFTDVFRSTCGSRSSRAGCRPSGSSSSSAPSRSWAHWPRPWS